ncbi:glycosyltransferase family 4 protein [Streptomyces heilongjiangensis]|uniref:D-inositol 3-phosphate glycosyltransferase n=1 Tax=Streptomyces heilongjiangensis TaxID=945052 RepID=A0ABW1BA20_9ACTN|nr:glycosyltransferase family 4 protein [Streptomyces heilongjiangensis]MDC2947219.1 glycosyltransferase family 4 protein [Streptomyces heilongjiangensis]
MKITFLLHNAYAIGGTVRSTLTLAGALAARHEVEIVSVFRTAAQPLLGVSGDVRLIPLVDERPDSPAYDGGHELMARPSVLVPPTEVLAHRYTALTDARLRAFLDTTDADVLVATRPALVVVLAGHGPRHAIRIGQEHLSYDHHVPGVRAAQNEAIARLDAFVTVSARDAADHRRRLPGPRTRITDIPNAAPRPRAEPSDLRAPLVVAAGRLVPVKRYDLLVEAFAKVVAERPEWRLRIHGQGPERARLRAAVAAHGLNDHVFLMGPHTTLETEWAKASVAVVSSAWESFGMTILEAMHAGVPVVATDCPHGPGEIITDGSDGLLVPPDDPDALATGLLRLINDPGLRRTLGTAGRTTVQRYAPATVADRYERLIAEVRGARRPGLVAGLGRWLGLAVPEQGWPARRTAPGRGTRRAVPERGARRAGAAPAAGTGRRPSRPRADCRVDARRDVRVAVGWPDASGQDLVLVLRHRHGDDELRVPLEREAPEREAPEQETPEHETPDAPASRWTALLRLGRPPLAEGRWDLYAERAGDGVRRRLRAGLVEQRNLLTSEFTGAGPVAWWIPYTTKDGYLALRTFHRTAHAEVTALPVGEGSSAVEGVLHGAALGAGAALVGVARGGQAADFEAPVECTGGRLPDGHPCHGRLFHGRVPSPPEPAAPGKVIWDLFLRPATDAEPIRLGRLFGDIVNRRDTDTYPEVTLPTPPGGSVRVRFFFTVTNDLAVSVSRPG